MKVPEASGAATKSQFAKPLIYCKLKKHHNFLLIFFTKKFAQKFFLPYLCTRNQGLKLICDASLAQLVEHDTLNVGVQGSSP